MELSVLERLILLNSLPAQGDITTIKIVRKLREDLSFSEEEHKALNLRLEGDRTVWNLGTVPKEVKIGEKGMSVIRKALMDLNANKQLHSDHLDVYEKFVGPVDVE
jgi:predicted RNA-binding protein with PUA domain